MKAVAATDLPEDVMRLVFSHLQDVREVASARRVCRGWRVLVDQHTAVWRSLSFKLPQFRKSFHIAEKWFVSPSTFGFNSANHPRTQPFFLVLKSVHLLTNISRFPILTWLVTPAGIARQLMPAIPTRSFFSP
uniref:F-box domain-containing protein n=1 Tax=Erythrolobus madagascarensis TaxID=708628 RepID=A0A7S0T6D4_9RHOD